LIEVAPSAKLGEDDRSVAQPMRPAGSCHAEDVPLPKCVRLMRVATCKLQRRLADRVPIGVDRLNRPGG
jgi:hypothetical protein